MRYSCGACEKRGSPQTLVQRNVRGAPASVAEVYSLHSHCMARIMGSCVCYRLDMDLLGWVSWYSITPSIDKLCSNWNVVFLDCFLAF